MGISAKNRNKDPYDQERPIYADDRGRLCINPGLDGDLYKLTMPPIAAGANKVHFDLFNGSTTKNLEIQSIVPMIDGATAVTGVLAVNLYLTRTTTVGTTGTAATYESATLTEPIFSKLDPSSPTLASPITARSAPGGGATAGAVLGMNSMFSEETNASTYNRYNLINLASDGMGGRVIVPPSTGIRVIQGSVASVGNIGFDILFAVVRQGT